MDNDFALIIGINDYTPIQKSGLHTLNGAINDAHFMEEWMLNPNGGAMPAQNCFKIISEPNPLKPIQEEVDIAITNIFSIIRNSADTARRFYFYFAGHGLATLTNMNDTALCLANWSEIRRNTALSSEAYKENIRQFGLFEEIIFIADCCRNTKINVNPLHPSFAPLMPNAAAAQTRMFVGYATQYQDSSFEIENGESEKRGVFTKVLIDGLNGAAVNSEGEINADKLRDYLIYQTPIEAQKAGYKQTPEIFHSFPSTFPIKKLENFNDNRIKCMLNFGSRVGNTIELIGNSGLVKTYEVKNKKPFAISLAQGLYLLKDTNNNDTKAFQALASTENLIIHF